MRGRKSKPSQLHSLHGTLNKTKHRARLVSEPVPVGDLSPEPPEWLPPGVAESWKYATAHCPRGLLKAIDSGLLLIWCASEDTFRRALAAQCKWDGQSPTPFLMRVGSKKDQDGNPIGGRAMASPYMKIMRDSALVMVRVAEQLGFSPAARPRLAAGLGWEYMPPSVAAAAIDGASAESENLDTFLATSPNRLN